MHEHTDGYTLTRINTACTRAHARIQPGSLYSHQGAAALIIKHNVALKFMLDFDEEVLKIHILLDLDILDMELGAHLQTMTWHTPRCGVWYVA